MKKLRSDLFITNLRNYIFIVIILFTCVVVVIFNKVERNLRVYPKAVRILESRQSDVSKQESNEVKYINTDLQDITEANLIHFVTNQVELRACSKNQQDLAIGLNTGISGEIVNEDDKNGIDLHMVIEGSAFHYYQLCYANHVDHQHSFKLTLTTIINTNNNSNIGTLRNPSAHGAAHTDSDSDCDMYLSASSVHPSPTSW